MCAVPSNCKKWVFFISCERDAVCQDILRCIEVKCEEVISKSVCWGKGDPDKLKFLMAKEFWHLLGTREPNRI